MAQVVGVVRHIPDFVLTAATADLICSTATLLAAEWFCAASVS